jgi:hypothetical protein
VLLKVASDWPERVGYLRSLYDKVNSLWNTDGPDGPLYDAAEPRVRELLVGLSGIAEEMPDRPDLGRMVRNAEHDFEVAAKHKAGAELELAVRFLAYSLLKVGQVLDGLARLARSKTAYGYDITGEVMEPGEQESRSPNLWDQGNSPKLDRTPSNPANALVDPEAEEEFPELKEEKHKRVEWPARTR